MNREPHDPQLEELQLHLDELARRYGYALGIVAFRDGGKMMISDCCPHFGGKAGATLARRPWEFFYNVGTTLAAAGVADHMERHGGGKR